MRCGSTTALARYLNESLSFIEKRNKFLGQGNLSSVQEKSLNKSKGNDAILIITILIVTG